MLKNNTAVASAGSNKTKRNTKTKCSACFFGLHLQTCQSSLAARPRADRVQGRRTDVQSS